MIRSTLHIVLCLAIFSVLNAASDPAMDDYLYARKLYDEKYYDLAADQLERLLRDHPQFKEVAEAQFLLGELYEKLQKYDSARAAFLKIAIVYSDSPRAPEALYRVGLALEKLNRMKEAAETYERVYSFYPNDSFSPKALSQAWKLYLQVGDTTRSESVGDLIIEKYPNSEAADEARLTIAQAMARSGDSQAALMFFQRIASQTSRKDLAILAWLEVARLYRSIGSFDSAETAYNLIIKELPVFSNTITARFELSDLYILRGMMEAAITVVTPLTIGSTEGISASAHEQLGDIYFLKGQYVKAIELYEKAKFQKRAVLKLAWTYEITGQMEKAEQLYRQLHNLKDKIGLQSKIRSATIAFQSEDYKSAEKIWLDAITSVDKDYEFTDRLWYELARTRFHGQLPGVDQAADSLMSTYPNSPYADDVLYMAAEQAVTQEKYSNALAALESIERTYPASDFMDSVVVFKNFIHKSYIRGDRLVERMAELSSRPASNPTQKAIDWGDFYLDQFRDPIKAIDQYDWVLSDILASTDNHIYALYRSGQAYLLLYEKALRENDDFAIEMYRDSTLSRLEQIKTLSAYSDKAASLTRDLLNVELFYTTPGTAANDSALAFANEFITKFTIEQLSPQTVAYFIESQLARTKFDSTLALNLLDCNKNAYERTSDIQLKSHLLFQTVLIKNDLQMGVPAFDTALDQILYKPHTKYKARSCEWLLESTHLPQEGRLSILKKYKEDLPYRLEQNRYYYLLASLLDSLNKPIDAIAAYNTATKFENWSRPELDIFEIPSDSTRFQLAEAYFRINDYENAYNEFRILLNLKRDSPYAPRSLLRLAQICSVDSLPTVAIAYLDSLEKGYPGNLLNKFALHLRPELLMRNNQYGEAYKFFDRLIKSFPNVDSLFHFRTQQLVCLYRRNQLVGEKDTLKAFLKFFKDRTDLDNVQALFTLERGQALDRLNRREDARTEYNTILAKFPLSDWADDAAYSSALSYIAQGKYDEGIVGLKWFVENYPSSINAKDALMSLGNAYYKAEKYPEAATAIRTVWEDDSAQHLWLEAFDALLSVYRDLQFWDAAIRITRDYIERFPNAPDVLDRRMDIGQFYLQLGEYAEGIRYYTPLLPLADAEREAEIQFYIGEAYYYKGDYRKAILEYLKVKILGRKTKLDWGVTALYQAGLAYEQLKEWDGAARMYKKIIDERGEASNYGMAAKKKLDALPKK